MSDYFKNSVINFKKIEYFDDTGVTQKDGQQVKLVLSNYKSIDFKKFRKMIAMCPTSWFSLVKLQNHTNIEKLSQDLYGSPNYWDLIILINDRMPLFEFPYDYDVVELIVDNMVDDYIKRVYKKPVTEETRNRIRIMFSEKVANDNEKFRYIKVINRANLYNFIQLAYETGILENDDN